jgi:hypothetical protein
MRISMSVYVYNTTLYVGTKKDHCKGHHLILIILKTIFLHITCIIPLHNEKIFKKRRKASNNEETFDHKDYIFLFKW